MDNEQKSMEEQEKATREKAPFRHGIGHVLLELLATVFILAVLAIGVLVWRLTTGPIDIAFAKPTIKEALYDPITGMNVDFDKAVLQWPDLKGPLLLGLSGGKIFDGDGNLILAIDSAALSLNKAKLLLAQVAPEGLILRKPSVLLKRSAENKFSIGLTSSAGDKSSSDNSAAEISLDDILDVFRQDEGRESGRLAKLKLVKIEDARVLIDDKVLSRSWQVPRVDISLQRERDGMRARYNIDLPRLPKTPKKVSPNIEGDVFAGWQGDEIQIESILTQFHTRFLSDKIPELSFLKGHNVRLDATATAVLSRDFSVREAQVIVFSKGGELDIPEFDDKPLAYSDFGVRLTYDGMEKLAKLDALKITTGGVTFTAQADMVHAEGGIHSGFAAKGRVDVKDVTHEQIVPLWPQVLDDDSSKEWVIDKLSEGVFHNVYTDFEVTGEPDEDGELSVDLTRLKAGFDFENLRVKYKSSMAPATHGFGKGEFDYESETIRIDLTSAQILDMKVPEATLVFSNIIEAGQGQADLTLKVEGPFQSMLRYLSDEPIGVHLDGDINAVKGDILADINLKFPTRDNILKADVLIDVDGSISDLHLPKVVQDLPLSKGPYNISVKDGVFALTGQGQLDGRDIDLDYREFLFAEGKPYSSKTKVKMVIDDDLRAKLGIDLSDFMRGAATVDVDYTKKNDGTAIADVKADIGSAVLFFNPFDYEKTKGQPGDVTLKAHLKDDNLTKITDLVISAPDISLKPSSLGFRTFNGDTEISTGTINEFVIGKTKGKIDFDVSSGGVLNLSMDASILDMAPFLNRDVDDDGAKENPPMRISVTADRMLAPDESVFRNGKIFADLNGEGQFNQVEFDAVAGKGALYVRFKPDVNGKRVFRLEADDAGAVLSAFGLYPNVRGGKLIIHGEPVKGFADRNLIGKARMSDFRVVKAPGLAQIISALSLPGAADMLAGEGLAFSKLEADFDWLFRPEGSVLVVKDGRTSGNALGLTFEGTFNNAKNYIDIDGTIIPLSGINNILQDIPLVGNILGGTSGLFAATYQIKGEGKDPDVSVNPLSVLAPGILRSILFEGSAPTPDD
ncbi:MAG: DUF3971 domain-containing protein [Alphaproteobacteria bacterium]|nr:DUF3971 domain-containing protein [Alphaproteobacteria bacterium]